jgi:hypothetical protein
VIPAHVVDDVGSRWLTPEALPGTANRQDENELASLHDGRGQ